MRNLIVIASSILSVGIMLLNSTQPVKPAVLPDPTLPKVCYLVPADQRPKLCYLVKGE